VRKTCRAVGLAKVKERKDRKEKGVVENPLLFAAIPLFLRSLRSLRSFAAISVVVLS
jgi:hypothetical protein